MPWIGRRQGEVRRSTSSPDAELRRLLNDVRAGDADDARWGSALSIGEHDVSVTLSSVASFLRAIGGGGVAAGIAANVTRLVAASP